MWVLRRSMCGRWNDALELTEGSSVAPQPPGLSSGRGIRGGLVCSGGGKHERLSAYVLHRT